MHYKEWKLKGKPQNGGIPNNSTSISNKSLVGIPENRLFFFFLTF